MQCARCLSEDVEFRYSSSVNAGEAFIQHFDHYQCMNCGKEFSQETEEEELPTWLELHDLGYDLEDL